MTIVLIVLTIIVLVIVLLLVGIGMGLFWPDVFPAPDDILDETLLENETVVLKDTPALTAFVISQHEVLLLLSGIVFLIAIPLLGWSSQVFWLTFLATVLVLLHLRIRRLGDFYTLYVLTNFRVMRITGVFHHRNYSIPWVKITDFAWEQSLAGRIFGYATIRIESANEESGLKLLRDLKYPVKFHKTFVEMVRRRQGTVDVADLVPPVPAGGPPVPVGADDLAGDDE